MIQSTYAEVIKLVDQLTLTEQRALVEYLQEQAKEKLLSSEQWNMLFDSLKTEIPLGDSFSLRREDWYGDDGR
jgi:hypothetical protein